MRRCLELAKLGFGKVAPNPMVGCIIVHNDRVIGEGYHEKYGSAHAEVNAIRSVQQKELLKQSSLYVNLEPCSHFGKTPPCVNLILEQGIREVIIGTIDPNPLVSGKGIQHLKEAGINVIPSILEQECRQINKRFFTFHEKKRPYIILKWAETKDGFISRYPIPNSREENRITGNEANILNHQWRSQESAIMVGTNTVINDNPELTTRHVAGKNPTRILIDKKGSLRSELNVFKNNSTVIVFSEQQSRIQENIEYIHFNFKTDILEFILQSLYNRNIQSVIIEGGSTLLNSFLEKNLWDEIRILKGNIEFKTGVEAPSLNLSNGERTKVGNDEMIHFSKLLF